MDIYTKPDIHHTLQYDWGWLTLDSLLTPGIEERPQQLRIKSILFQPAPSSCAKNSEQRESDIDFYIRVCVCVCVCVRAHTEKKSSVISSH